MLFLLFNIGAERYALESSRVVEIIPRVPARAHPGTPGYVAGMVNYRGTIVPVLDLKVLAGGAPCGRLMSTRIILVEYPDKHGALRLLGLVAESVTETAQKELEDFVPAGVVGEKTPFLGHVALDGGDMVQCVTIERLLPAEVENLLFTE